MAGEDLTLLAALADRHPSADLALAQAAALRAQLALPKGIVHVVSDVHGEYAKLRHVINNASGSLRPLVDRLFEGRLSADERRQLLGVLYYPREMMDSLARLKFQILNSKPEIAGGQAPRESRVAWVKRTLRQLFEIVRELARSWRRADMRKLMPPQRLELFEELFDEPTLHRPPEYLDAMIDALAEKDRDLAAVRAAARLVRNLSSSEIIVAGDLGDRGPRIDRVIDYLMQQPNVALVWGNHDVSWMGACLGQEALIATVLRFSCRYRRLSQLEEGYGLILSPLEKLARDVYGDDPAEHFIPKGEGLRDELMMARMQKAAAIMQFKLEAQTSRRHPDWDMESRNLLHRIDRESWTIDLGGSRFPLRDRHLPTVNAANPYELSKDEHACMDRLRESFIGSTRLWQHMSWVVRRGSMWLRRDDALIFHACVPVDSGGRFLSLDIDDRPCSGREMFDALETVIRRAFRKGADNAGDDADWLWYLWAGPRSPLFGKDRMATFEGYFIDDKQTHKETKNPYFDLMHDAGFCRQIGGEFGIIDDVLIVNGHVPVKVEKGERPLKRGGNAVTIDGAFSKAYGDRGYTLILAPDGISIAEHHPFDSIQQVITSGADIVPTIEKIRSYPRPRTVGETEEGQRIRDQIRGLDQLIAAYEAGVVLEREVR